MAFRLILRSSVRSASVIVPESFDGPLGNGRTTVALQKVIEERKLITAQHITLWIGLNARPEVSDGIFEDGGGLLVYSTILTIAGLVQGLSDTGKIFRHGIVEKVT